MMKSVVARLKVEGPLIAYAIVAMIDPRGWVSTSIVDVDRVVVDILFRVTADVTTGDAGRGALVASL